MGFAVKPLANIHVLSLACNLPGPVAAARLGDLGAAIVKVEPPEGDALAEANPAWYRALHQGQEVIRLNLKAPGDRDRLNQRLGKTDLLLTSFRPSALERLGLGWTELHARFPRLCQVAIVGHGAPHEELPGHDLTYQADVGLLSPPALPPTVLADLGGALEAVNTALGLILARERGHGSGYAQVSLAQAAAFFAEPLRRGMTMPTGPLGGGLPIYNLYRTRDGWIALAALEPRFWNNLTRLLELSTLDKEQLQRVFLTRTARDWESWAREHDLPIVALRDTLPVEEIQ
jgi:crotonobetainyl-CoA:carnitine CoA-transferase CaiB-like acyl-CoA transferase